MNIRSIEITDSNNNIIERIFSNGNKEWYEYDQNNNEIHYKNVVIMDKTKNIEYWKDYDQYNNCIRQRYSDGDNYWYRYDSEGNTIYSRDADGTECWYENSIINN